MPTFLPSSTLIFSFTLSRTDVKYRRAKVKGFPLQIDQRLIFDGLFWNPYSPAPYIAKTGRFYLLPPPGELYGSTKYSRDKVKSSTASRKTACIAEVSLLKNSHYVGDYEKNLKIEYQSQSSYRTSLKTLP